MHRSRSTLLSRLDKDSGNKKSLWGTIKTKRRVNGSDETLKKKNASGLSSSSSFSTISSQVNDTEKYHTAGSVSPPSDSASSSIPSTPSPLPSRPLSISQSPFNYSLDPNNHGTKLLDPPVLATTAIPISHTTQINTDRKSKRISRMFDSDFNINTSETSTTVTRNKQVPNLDRNAHKRHSMMFGKSSAIPADYLKILLKDETKPQRYSVIEDNRHKRLSMTFEDYTLLLQAYGENPEENTVEKSMLDTKQQQPLSGIDFNTDIDDKIEIKLISNCVCIGSHETSIFDNGRQNSVNKKLSNIDIRVNDDLNGIFNEDDEDEDYTVSNKIELMKKVQRTSLYFV